MSLLLKFNRHFHHQVERKRNLRDWHVIRGTFENSVALHDIPDSRVEFSLQPKFRRHVVGVEWWVWGLRCGLTHYWLPLFTLKNKFFKPQPGTQPVGLIRSTLRIFVGVRSSDFWTFGLSDFRTCMYYVRLIWSVIRLSDLPSFPWCDAFLFSLSTILYHHSTAQRSTAYHSIAWHSIHRIQLLNHLLAPDISPATDWRWVWTSLTLTIVCLIHR